MNLLPDDFVKEEKEILDLDMGCMHILFEFKWHFQKLRLVIYKLVFIDLPMPWHLLL